jgi:predicted ATP-dependent endonuclease of OLD family
LTGIDEQTNISRRKKRQKENRMEISKIVIENFKEIEHVELNPVKPINVLIGRNNSGKSSVLTCINFLHEYFGRNNAGNTIKLPTGYFREGLDKTPEMKISISVEQSKEERKEQFIRTKDAWNQKYSSPLWTGGRLRSTKIS